MKDLLTKRRNDLLLTCPRCGSLYESPDFLQKNPDERHSYLCPNKGCHGVVFNIDEPLIPLVRWLTKNGFHVFFCCSGYFYDTTDGPYILMQCPPKFLADGEPPKSRIPAPFDFYGKAYIEDKSLDSGCPLCKIGSHGHLIKGCTTLTLRGKKIPKLKSEVERESRVLKETLRFIRAVQSLFKSNFNLPYPD